MKFFGSQVIKFLQDRPRRFNLLAILRFVGLLTALVACYSLIFQYLMAYEGRPQSFITGIYWTLTVMSTLGFGDITFQSDIGKLFSTLVLLSGIFLLLILLPFTFIEFFYEPWIRAQKAARAPKQLPEKNRRPCHHHRLQRGYRSAHRKAPAISLSVCPARARPDRSAAPP